MPRADSPDAEDALKQQETHAIQDFELPKTLVTRIAKAALPDNIKLQKEAVTALVMSSTVFINYLAATAQDVTWSRSAKTITAQDVLKALEIIEFDDQVEPMKRELAAWKAAQDPKSKARKRPAAGEEENPYARPAGKRKSKTSELAEEEKGEGEEEEDAEEGEDADVEEGDAPDGEGEAEGEAADGEDGEDREPEAGEDEEMDEDEPPEGDPSMDVEDPGPAPGP